jgi:hypothetical protein
MGTVNTGIPAAWGAEAPDPLKMFLLDLLYPAVLGALIVFLFARLASSDLQALKEPSTHFGIILAVFYAAGFIAAKLSPKYTLALATVDFLSSVLMFICFYILGLSQETPSAAVNYRNFYIVLLIVVLSPMLRRAIMLGHRPHFRHGLAIAAAVIVVLALLVEIAHGPFTWLTPPVIAALLYGLLVVYFIHIRVGGIVAE